MPKYVLLICPVIIMSLVILTELCTEAQDNDSPKQTLPTRKLPSNRRREAGAARDRADLMRARFERQLAPSDHSKSKEPQTETLDEAEVVEAYEEVIETYAHTDIAVYCAMRLAGFYGRLGHVDKSLRLLEATASEFEGTHEASKVMYETGLFHAEVRKDQASAMECFRRIPDPSPPAPNDRNTSGYNDAVKFYVLAQKQLANSDAKKLPILKPAPLPAPRVSNQTREYLLDELHDSIQRCPGQKLNAEVQGQLALYRQSEFDVVDGLRDLYRLNGTVRERTIILLALREVGTSQATSLIQEIASEPGNDAATLGPRAVRLLSSMGADTDRLSQLLTSSSTEIRDSAAMELAGKELTATAVERLGKLLKSDSWEAHNFVISAFASDRSSKTARRKLELLIAALARLDKLEDEPQLELSSRSPRSFVMCGYVTTLAHMLGADEIVHEQFYGANAGSIEYKVLAIASAMRKDKSARPALLEIARTEKNNDLRHMAVVGLQFVGNKQDLEFLRKLAVEDPYVLQVRADYKPHAIEVQFPVRSAAKQAIDVLIK